MAKTKRHQTSRQQEARRKKIAKTIKEITVLEKYLKRKKV